MATVVEMPESSTAANAISLQISLPQMLDLALGAPEVGAVNFNMLHNFLHVVLHQANLQTTKVEYHGENAERIKRMITSLKPALQPEEYVTDAVDEISQQIRKDDDADVDVTTGEEIIKVKDTTQPIGFQISETQVVTDDSPPTSLAFKKLEESVKKLQQQFQALEALSTSPEIIEGLKDRMTDPTADIWQFVNINKRLDANEQGINKLTAMIQDITKGDVSIADTSAINAKLNELEDKISKMEQWFINLQAITDIMIEDSSMLATDMEEKEEIEAATEEKEEIDAAETVPYPEKEEKAKEISKITIDKIRKATTDKFATRITSLNEAIAEMREDIAMLKTDVNHILQELDKKITESESPTDVDELLEKPVVKSKEEIVGDVANLEQCFEAIKNIETTYNKTLDDVSQRMLALEAEIGNLLEKIDNMQEIDKTEDVNKLSGKMQGIETDMERIGQTIDTLLSDKEQQETNISTLLEQIEFLKTVKASKEDLEDALADKADTQIVNRKVSHEQFDAACDDLTRGLEEAIEKLSKQESIWEQTLDEVENKIACKVDRNEMTPLKDFVNNKLKSLHQKLKIIMEASQEIEAAGTKKLLRDVQCISCDKDVVMRTQVLTRFRTDPLPCTISIKPYLTYKLDKIRKQQKRLPYGKSMNQFESMMQQGIRQIKPKNEMLPRDHLCNRYCGGSHTLTTPQQRVTRQGNYFTQCGPEMIQLTDNFIRGKNGQMYRSRSMQSKDICGPNCESDISEETEFFECDSTNSRKMQMSQQNIVKNQKRNFKK